MMMGSDEARLRRIQWFILYGPSLPHHGATKDELLEHIKDQYQLLEDIREATISGLSREDIRKALGLYPNENRQDVTRG